ncbi:ATPase [Rufibacter sp. DG15C]|uniref:restriction endonuclease n=1 Tax=Rufibacter sp. DG15C TaxID=1379909 RepID=UPI00078CE367|nr:restriction endonuclease [Rufibacter sp. DG15C]AMM51915.1 ATPase [Rufibacter sp. DG15C]
MKKNKQDIYITKSSGESALFSYHKLKRSLAAAGATQPVIEDIIAQVENDLYQGISTKLIYKKAFSLLKRRPGALAARYKLKSAIMELGPAGFAFERFVGALFQYKGYQVVVSRILQGRCVPHEVDVIATKGLEQLFIECKFHNLPNYQCDVKIPLYVHSRFKDIEEEQRKKPGNKNLSYQGWIVTNTRFSVDATTYGTCAGLQLLSWNYPEGRGLKELVEQSGIHPITSLTSLTHAEKQHLLEDKVVLCKELCQAPALLEDLGIGSDRLKRILREAHDLCDQ